MGSGGGGVCLEQPGPNTPPSSVGDSSGTEHQVATNHNVDGDPLVKAMIDIRLPSNAKQAFGKKDFCLNILPCLKKRSLMYDVQIHSHCVYYQLVINN